MSLITSKQQKRYGIVDPIFILFSSALVILALFALSTGNVSDLIEDVLGSFSTTQASSSVNNVPSFASDLRYWEANCTGKWSSDAICEAIAARTQSCTLSVDSVYCSAYDNYLQQYHEK
jgi:hypothetical protein